ncbi:MAG: GAF domain-containing protein [Ignavibacteriaceae bacterium]|nr:GAF domain-containing protein [Ignavibacteriaceae bacterium]
MKYSNALLIVAAATLLILFVLFEDFLLKAVTFIVLLITSVILFLRLDGEKKAQTEPPEENLPLGSSLGTDNPESDGIINRPAEKVQDYTDVNLDHVDEGFSIVRKSSRVLTENNITTIGNKLSSSDDDTEHSLEKFRNLATEEFPVDLAANQQLSFLLERILIIVRELFSAHTAIYFWYDKRKSTLTIEKYASVSHEIEKKKLEIQNDILGQIISKQEPGLLTDIPQISERENFRYYTHPQKIKSFLGVPVFHNSNLIGILAVDSKSPDAFGIEQMYMLGRFVRLITVLIDLFAHKHAESIANRRSEGFADFLSQNIHTDDEESLYHSIAALSSILVESDCFSFVTWHQEEHQFKVSAVINPKAFTYIESGEVIERDNTIVGKCVFTGSQVRIGDLNAASLKRFSHSEDILLDGSFMAVPIIYHSEVLGALCFESMKKNAFTQRDHDYLKKVTGQLGILMHAFGQIKRLKSLITFDPETGVYSSAFFRRRAAEELEKASILNLRSNLVLIKIDEGKNRQELSDPLVIKNTMKEFADALDQELDALSFCGRLDDLTFALFFLHNDEQELAVRADKIRVKIARIPVSTGSRSTTFTVSIGLLNSTDKTDVDELLEQLRLAVKKASETGGNKVLQL